MIKEKKNVKQKILKWSQCYYLCESKNCKSKFWKDKDD